MRCRGRGTQPPTTTVMKRATFQARCRNSVFDAKRTAFHDRQRCWDDTTCTTHGRSRGCRWYLGNSIYPCASRDGPLNRPISASDVLPPTVLSLLLSLPFSDHSRLAGSSAVSQSPLDQMIPTLSIPVNRCSSPYLTFQPRPQSVIPDCRTIDTCDMLQGHGQRHIDTETTGL